MRHDGQPARTRAPRGAGRLVAAALAILALGACAPRAGREVATQMTTFRDVPDSSWRALAQKRVFFGHQSVGGEIVDCISELVREKPALGLRVVAADSLPAEGGCFAHAFIGRNGEPGLKTDDFAQRIEGGIGRRADIAFHKYCFADIAGGTDVAAVFAHYRTVMTKLRADYPGVTFVHVTTPLVTSRAGGAKLVVQRLLGRAPQRVGSNIARERFNDLMRAEYAGREPVFDLAQIESTRPDGRREGVAFGGRPGYALFPGYSSDGSHLNEAGRRRVAEALLVFLAGLPDRDGRTPAAR